MADTKTIIERAYSAFNKRDIDGALARIIRENEDAEAPFCYKHDVESMFKQEMRLPRD
jgi:hypothetical protein